MIGQSQEADRAGGLLVVVRHEFLHIIPDNPWSVPPFPAFPSGATRTWPALERVFVPKPARYGEPMEVPIERGAAERRPAWLYRRLFLALLLHEPAFIHAMAEQGAQRIFRRRSQQKHLHLPRPAAKQHGLAEFQAALDFRPR